MLGDTRATPRTPAPNLEVDGMELGRGQAGGLHYLELVPEGARGDLPLVVGMHGRGAAAEDLGGVVAQLDDQHYRYVLFYAPRVLYLGDGIRYAWYDSAIMDETLPKARRLVLAALRELWGRHGVAPQQTVLFGFSQGGVMTYDAGFHLEPEEPLAGMVAMSARLYKAADLDAALASHREQPVCIVHGKDDPNITIEDATTARKVLERAGLQPEYHEFPMGHEVTADSLAAVRSFVHRVLPPG
jgi:phospholipase/carboxylesterase